MSNYLRPIFTRMFFPIRRSLMFLLLVIAVVSNRSTAYEIYAMSPGDSMVVQVTSGGGNAAPNWTH